jgi:MFS transporter, DHA1 family, tetracycline resistance protein
VTGTERVRTPMSPLVVIVLIVLVDLLGFTIVMPLLAPFAQSYGFSPLQIGLILAAFPICQLIAGPILGRLSDRYGRRPVLIFSQAGTALSFLMLGLSRDFRLMLLARMLDGASGGNILVAQAYIADVTKPEHRARSYGLIGAAFGVGFVLGPLLGGLIVSLPVAPEWRLRLPFLVAAGFSTLAWFLVLTRLPESRPPEGSSRSMARVLSLRGLADTARLPGVGRLIGVGMLNILAFAALEATFALYLRDYLGWTERGAMFGFAYLGLVTAAVQGGLIRRLVPRFGEPRLVIAGLVLSLLGFAWLALTSHTLGLLGAILAIGVGQGLVSPSVAGLLSRVTPASEQGAVFGVFSSSQTVARMINYLAANLLFGWFGPTAPFWEATAVAAATLTLAALTIGPGLVTESAQGIDPDLAPGA